MAMSHRRNDAPPWAAQSYGAPHFAGPPRRIPAVAALMLVVTAISQSALASTDGSLWIYCGPSVLCNPNSTDDVIPLYITKTSGPNVGTIQLEVLNHGSGDIKILRSDKSGEQYSVAVSLLPVTLWVQGIAVSSELEDVTIHAEWLNTGGAADVHLTVIDFSLDVQGATQDNVIGSENWASVRSGSGDVVVSAVIVPSGAQEMIDWTGGEVVPNQPLQRKVAKALSAKTTVTASIGSVEELVNIWIVGATVSIKTEATDSIPDGVDLEFHSNDPHCGPTTWMEEGLFFGCGNMYGAVQLTPTGVHEVVTSGWDIKRDKIARCKADGQVDPNEWDAGWVDDDKYDYGEVLTPDADDCIHVIDWPVIGVSPGPTTYEYKKQFREWVEWNGDECSEKDAAHWYYKGTWHSGSPPTITEHDVGTGDLIQP